MCIKPLVLFLFFSGLSIGIQAQHVKKINRQQYFSKTVPPGNYSGITFLGDDRYAVVSDKSDEEGYFVFRIKVDSVSGKIKSVGNIGFKSLAVPNRDAEGITYMPEKNTLFIVGERDSRIVEYDTIGVKTGREIQLEMADGNYGYESLSYNAMTATLWTCTENRLPRDRDVADGDAAVPVLRLQSFDNNLMLKNQYLYRMDSPVGRKSYRYYAHGVSEILALDNGALLVLEREFAVPDAKIGAFVVCKLYKVNPSVEQPFPADDSLSASAETISKELLGEWKTRLTLVNYDIANYEGMCLGPRLADGSQVIVLVADSQNQKGGVLRDWFRTIIISE